MKKIMDGNEACSYVAYKFSEVCGIYPITPASPMAELIDKWSNEGKLNFFDTPVKVVEMESEAGAAGMIHGSLQAGCLTSTFTASQGLLLMIPNMYKIAGELLPCVVNVAARSLATHALSIFGDHQDVYAARATGFAILASSSVSEVMDLTGVSYLSAIKGRVPFINFFDGFRTSHELQKVDVIDTAKLKDLIDKKALQEFRDEALNPNKPVTKGTAQNEDIYFQQMEVRNKYYDKLDDTVNCYMQKINAITGNNYAPFEYYGSPKATKIIVAMGSVCNCIKEVIDYLNSEKHLETGLIEVHLYRPFSSKYFLKAIPKSVKKIAVLDRTKEAGSTGEPLYLDVVNVLKENDVKVNVYGGRYGLSSKNTTPAMIKGIYDFLDTKDVHTNFTVGINDDVTNLSIDYDKEFKLPTENTEFLVYGYGSDGMVSACKDLMKITGNNTLAYVQGYFQYDSKKSGGTTVSHLRFGKNPINSSYYVEDASLIVCTNDNYLTKIKMLEKIKKDGIFLLNSKLDKDEILKVMTNHDKEILRKRHIKFYVIDAGSIARSKNLGNKISSIMEILIFKLGKIIDFDFCLEHIKQSLKVRFANKSGDIALKNIEAIDEAVDAYYQVKVPDVDYVKELPKKRDLFEVIYSMEGDSLPVSSFIKHDKGIYEGGLSKREKRNIAEVVPSYDCNNCISCNLCSLVCPHAVIRPFLLDEKEEIDAPKKVQDSLINANIKDSNLKFTVGVSYKDCTGCSLCTQVCPGKTGKKALSMTLKENITPDMMTSSDYLFNEVKEKKVMAVNTIKGSQFVKPAFEFSGACAGCGETPYLKLLTQLFKDNLVIANATGCSSIYGASLPSTPYTVAWANSLFEDNAEFGYGMRIADDFMKNRIKSIIKSNIATVKNSEKAIYQSYLDECDIENANKLYDIVDDSKIETLKSLKEFIKPKNIWTVGGDGWAYDIGYNGIDHVLASTDNVNILVLDTEVYSNTGGQSSKSTRFGAIAKFASNGKKTVKKDLAKMALSYPHVYVGTISLGANYQQAIKVLLEASNYNGPSIVIAYSPCIAQGIVKGMKNSINEEKEATKSGYFPIFHYNPETKEFKIDSNSDFSTYLEFLLGEDRYKALEKTKKDAQDIYETNKKQAMQRYEYYKEREKD